MKRFAQNLKGTDYFVGDLHGMYDLFMAKLAEIDFDFDNDRMFCVGDLQDRGPDSVKCIELLNKSWFHCALGNHEEMMHGSEGLYCWMRNGGIWSLGIDNLNDLKDLVRDKCYQFFEVIIFFEGQKRIIGVVHAESELDWNHNNNNNSMHINTWARTKIRGNTDNIKNIDRVVVGHTPLKKVVRLGNVVYIDTGAYYTNNLTVMTAEQVFEA